MIKIEVTEEQARLIQRALDFYSRVGIGQFTEIKAHPTFEKSLHRAFALGEGKFEVGDKTVRGEVVEVDPKYKWIKTKGVWNGGEEIKKWTDLDNIEYSTDYTRFHAVRDTVDNVLNQAKKMLCNDYTLGNNASWGIYNEQVDESCRVAYDILQHIRHHFWKNNPNRSSITVDSSVHTSTEDGDKIKVSDAE